MSLDLTLADFREEPFHYGLFRSVFVAQANAALLEWLEDSNAWKLVQTDFYEQYEFCVDDVHLPSTVRFLQLPLIRAELCNAIGSLFKVELSSDVRLLAHKLVSGQHIGIHNDVIKGGETHRLTVQLNRGLTDEDGGFYMLFNSPDPSDIHKILKPLNNSALAFAISEHSEHAVSVQHSGVRFTLVFCFNER